MNRRMSGWVKSDDTSGSLASAREFRESGGLVRSEGIARVNRSHVVACQSLEPTRLELAFTAYDILRRRRNAGFWRREDISASLSVQMQAMRGWVGRGFASRQATPGR